MSRWRRWQLVDHGCSLAGRRRNPSLGFLFVSSSQRFDPGQFVHTVIRLFAGETWIDLVPDAETSRDSGDVIIVEPVHVISGCNPGYRESDEVNRMRHMNMERRLRESGAEPRPAIGMSPDGSWVEPSWFVAGLPRAVVCSIGREYGQVAVFEVDAFRIHVLKCAGEDLVASTSYRVAFGESPVHEPS